MMQIPLLFIAVTLFAISILAEITFFFLSRNLRKELIKAENKSSEINEKLTKALRNSRADVVEFESLKIWLGSNIKAMHEHNEKMEEFLKANETLEVNALNQSKVDAMRKMLEIQGKPGTWDQDGYTLGMYNGMEMMLSIAEDREPVFKENNNGWKDFARGKY